MIAGPATASFSTRQVLAFRLIALAGSTDAGGTVLGDASAGGAGGLVAGDCSDEAGGTTDVVADVVGTPGLGTGAGGGGSGVCVATGATAADAATAALEGVRGAEPTL